MPFDLNFAAARAALDQYLAYLPGLSNPDRRPAPGTPYAQAFVPGTWQPVAPRARPQVGRANAYYSSEGPYWVSHHLDERSSEATHYEAAALAIWGELRGLGLLARLPADVPLRLLLSGHQALLDPAATLAQVPGLSFQDVQHHLALAEHLLRREWGREPAYLTTLYDQGLLRAWLGRLRQVLGE